MKKNRSAFANIISFLLIFIFIQGIKSNLTFSQVKRGYNTIKGKIYDAETKNPIPSAIIFLKNTTIGTSADIDGNYEIKRIPNGEYEIIFSQAGYEMQSEIMSLFDSDTIIHNIYLKLKVLQFEEIEILGHESSEWKENLKIFIKEFIGSTRNAEKCSILNPEVINFYKDSKTGEFSFN